MIDWVRVEELRKDFGEDDFLEIVSMFLFEVQERLDAMMTKDSCVLTEDFHFLKGSAANLGFRSFQSACSTAEIDLRAADIVEIADLFHTSKDVFLREVGGNTQVA